MQVPNRNFRFVRNISDHELESPTQLYLSNQPESQKSHRSQPSECLLEDNKECFERGQCEMLPLLKGGHKFVPLLLYTFHVKLVDENSSGGWISSPHSALLAPPAQCTAENTAERWNDMITFILHQI